MTILGYQTAADTYLNPPNPLMHPAPGDDTSTLDFNICLFCGGDQHSSQLTYLNYI